MLERLKADARLVPQEWLPEYYEIYLQGVCIGVMGNQKVSMEKTEFSNMPLQLQSQDKEGTLPANDNTYVEHSCLNGKCPSTPMRLAIGC